MKRHSKQRDLIYQAIVNSIEHPTADSIYNQLKLKNPELSLGTVYRNIKQLEDAGMIVRVFNGDSSDRFDGRTETHYHFTCKACGSVYDVELAIDEKLIFETTTHLKHSVETLRLNLYGKCSKCIEKEMS